MIDALIAGKMVGTAQSRVARNGSDYVTAKVRAAGGDSGALFVNVVAFSHSAGAALLALEDGDSVALTGTLTPKAYIDRKGDARPALDLMAHVVTTAYHVRRKRQAVQRDDADTVRGAEAGAAPLETEMTDDDL